MNYWLDRGFTVKGTGPGSKFWIVGQNGKHAVCEMDFSGRLEKVSGWMPAESMAREFAQRLDHDELVNA